MTKLLHLWHSQPCKSYQMYGMVDLALCAIKEGCRELLPLHHLPLHHLPPITIVSSVSAADIQYITASSAWRRPPRHPASCTECSLHNPHDSNPIASIFPSLLFPLLWPYCWQHWLYRLVAAAWLCCFVPVLFYVMSSYDNFGAKTSLTAFVRFQM